MTNPITPCEKKQSKTFRSLCLTIRHIGHKSSQSQSSFNRHRSQPLLACVYCDVVSVRHGVYLALDNNSPPSATGLRGLGSFALVGVVGEYVLALSVTTSSAEPVGE